MTSLRLAIVLAFLAAFSSAADVPAWCHRLPVDALKAAPPCAALATETALLDTVGSSSLTRSVWDTFPSPTPSPPVPKIVRSTAGVRVGLNETFTCGAPATWEIICEHVPSDAKLHLVPGYEQGAGMVMVRSSLPSGMVL